ncbi:hypothetical protein [Succinivibrio dextrinosolvens]|uniref:hypothetical protein n=1 Tax=Succinivibrio dextrinosolvens TaxID=83771 RepID=UPI001921F3C4|nr:hypothetical protein [Succinivibrio dextrinosolvens]
MSDRISNVSTNSNVQNNIIDNQENKPVNNAGNKPEEMQNAKKSGSKLALALKITATILTGGLFGIGWGIYALVKHAQKSSKTEPQNKDNTGLPGNNSIKKEKNDIIENQAEIKAEIKVEDKKPEPQAEPVKCTLKIEEDQAGTVNILTTEAVLKPFTDKKNYLEELDNCASRFRAVGQVEGMVNDLMEKLGNDNTEKVLHKLLGKDYDKVINYFNDQGLDEDLKLEMAVIYKLKNDAEKNPDDELFAKSRNALSMNQITLKELVNKFVETLQDALKENNIPSEIKVIETDGEDDGYNYNDDNNESFDDEK